MRDLSWDIQCFVNKAHSLSRLAICMIFFTLGLVVRFVSFGTGALWIGSIMHGWMIHGKVRIRAREHGEKVGSE